MIKQHGEYDCLLACLAMATGKDYRVIFGSEFCAEIEKAKGAHGDTVNAAAQLAGLTNENYKSVYTASLPTGNWKKLLWGRKAIIQVPSLNYEDGQHYVFWDGDEIHDPSNKQVYRWLDHLIPVYVWIFAEANTESESK